MCSGGSGDLARFLSTFGGAIFTVGMGGCVGGRTGKTGGAFGIALCVGGALGIELALGIEITGGSMSDKSSSLDVSDWTTGSDFIFVNSFLANKSRAADDPTPPSDLLTLGSLGVLLALPGSDKSELELERFNLLIRSFSSCFAFASKIFAAFFSGSTKITFQNLFPDKQ